MPSPAGGVKGGFSRRACARLLPLNANRDASRLAGAETGASVRVSRPASFDRHAHMLRIAQHAELRNAHLDARRLEVLEAEIGDALGEVFHEAVAFFFQHGAEVLNDDSVVDRVGDLPGPEDAVARER